MKCSPALLGPAYGVWCDDRGAAMGAGPRSTGERETRPMWKAWLSPGSSLSVGHGEMDEGHRALFRLFERVYSEAFKSPGEAAPRGSPQLPQRIEELCGALEEHFRVEEGLMEQHGYPDRLLHRAAHDGFREEIRFVIRALSRGELTP